MDKLIEEIRECTVCSRHLPNSPRPILSASQNSKIVIIGQAPGRKVHESGVPWDDPSGERLRAWLAVSKEEFYDVGNFAIVPMGFCFPGKGTSGDLPPRPECAPLWHPAIFDHIADPALTLLIGNYSQTYYLKDHAGRNLTETVRNFRKYLPEFLPLPHPSPRNRFWIAKNPWFEADVLPELRQRIDRVLKKSR